MKQQSIVEEQMQAGQIYMEQHKDEDGAVDQSAIEYVNSSAFNAKYNAMLQQIQVKKQTLIKEGKVREWKAYYDSRFSDTEAFQGLLMDRNVDQFLKNVDEVWANAHISG